MGSTFPVAIMDCNTVFMLLFLPSLVKPSTRLITPSSTTSLELVTLSTTSLEYPGYYLINVSKLDIGGLYIKTREKRSNYPVFKKLDSNVTLHVEDKRWNIGSKKLRSKALNQTCPGNGKWEMFTATKGWSKHSSVYVTPFTFPTIYSLEYTGTNQTAKDWFEKNNLEGKYINQHKNHNDVPYYANDNNSSLLLHKCVKGQWAISSSLDDDQGLLHQKGQIISGDKFWLIRNGNAKQKYVEEKDIIFNDEKYG